MGFKNIANKLRLGTLWSKYGLIVVGNIVFFILLYLFSYRPHNAENRASEFLSMGQLAETRERKETAVDLYEKVLADYPDTRAALTAGERLPVLKKSLTEKQDALPPPPVKCEEIDLEEMLRKGPAVYIATYVAKHFRRFPSDRAKLIDIISKYLKLALEWQKVPLKQLRGESELRGEFFQSQFFEIQPRCIMTSDWIYDDFSIRNDNFFSWNNVTVKLVLSQGEQKAEKTLRLPLVRAGEAIDITEFRVRSSSGTVVCRMEVKADEGDVNVSEEI